MIGPELPHVIEPDHQRNGKLSGALSLTSKSETRTEGCIEHMDTWSGTVEDVDVRTVGGDAGYGLEIRLSVAEHVRATVCTRFDGPPG